MSVESTQNKQQYDSRITCTEVGGKVMLSKNLIFF